MNQPQVGGDIPEWSLVDRLVKARTYASLNQQQLGTALGISERTIKRYEAGGPRKRGIILGWALACGVNPSWLEHGTNEPEGGDTPHTGVVTLGYVRRPVENYLVAA